MGSNLMPNYGNSGGGGGSGAGGSKGAENPNLLHPDRGGPLRARVLCQLGYALLRFGDGSKDKRSNNNHNADNRSNASNVDSWEGLAAQAFEGAIDAGENAMDASEDLTQGERNIAPKSHGAAVRIAEGAVKRARRGLEDLERFEDLRTDLHRVLNIARKQKSKGGPPVRMEDLEEAIELSPSTIEWHVEKLQLWRNRGRWFAVANHCERMAADATRAEGVYDGDLKEFDPFPGIPAAERLRRDFFDDADEFKEDGSNSINNNDSDSKLPPHLRVLNTQGTRDAAFRLPQQILPYYLRALRLEERYPAAVRANSALAEFASRSGDDNGSNSRRGSLKNGGDSIRRGSSVRFGHIEEPIDAHPTFLHLAEWSKLEKTIKLKEGADKLFREGRFEQAIKLYEECLLVDKEGDEGGWDNDGVSGAKSAGGRLHAVLHSNLAACHSSLRNHDAAILECTRATEVHSMYMKAILRRARVYVERRTTETMEDDSKHDASSSRSRSKADYDRWILLAEGAKRMRYPPVDQGPDCYFDMPGDVSQEEFERVKKERDKLFEGGGKGDKSVSSSKKASISKKISFHVRGGSSSDSRSAKGVGVEASTFTTPPKEGTGNNEEEARPRRSLLCCCFNKKKGKNAWDKDDGSATYEATLPPSSSREHPPPDGGGEGTVFSNSRSQRSPRAASPPPGSSRQSSARSMASSSKSSKSQRSVAASKYSRASTTSSARRFKLKSALVEDRPPFERPVDPIGQVYDVEVDYYRVLGLEEGNRPDRLEIKQAYHKLAVQCHPDRDKTEKAGLRFQELKLAYDVLGNDENRRDYDDARTERTLD